MIPHSFVAPSTHARTLARRIEEATFLVVDDFRAMRKIVSNQLHQLGAHRVLEAANGAEAAAILAKEPVTLVISDWNMSVMSGLDLLVAMRADPAHAALPFIMITAEAERGRIQEVIDAGVSELLVKPYTAQRFAEKLERALMRKAARPDAQAAARRSGERAAPPSAAEATPPRAAAGGQVAIDEADGADELNELGIAAQGAPRSDPDAVARPTILVVDDTPDNLRLLAHLFKEEFRIRIAHHGEKALRICQSDTPPDLILLDVMMPGIDGFEVAQQLREHPSSQHIPIIFVTALNDEESQRRGMALGAVDFVAKPINPSLLQVRVRNFMRYVSLHRQLQSDYDTMLEAARLKDDVDQIMRHDLKGPLAAVVGLARDLIDGGKSPTERHEQLRMIEDAALQTLDTINLSAEIYKIETGRFELEPRIVPLASIMRSLVGATREVFAVKHLDIALHSPGGVNVRGEPAFCYSLFQNLLKNACEAAPDRSRVSVTLSAEEAVKVVIENGGVVPAGIREHFFDKFATAGKKGGTGLGTYSAKLLTEAQGGAISMETSDEQDLTRLTVTLPRVPPA